MTIEFVITAVAVHESPRGFGSIVVPIDPDSDDHRALRVADRLAVLSGAAVDLVAVADPAALIRDEWRTHLQELAGTVDATRVRASIVRAHTVVDGVRETVAQDRAPIVCMETEAPGRFVDAFELTSGSAVVHHVDVPVVLVGPNAITNERSFDEIVAFVDTSGAAPVVVDQAARWAEALGLHLWVVEVVEPDAGLDQTDSAESSHVARLARPWIATGLPVDWEVLHGKDVPGELARFLGDHPSALAVMGSHGRSGWAELRLGSVSMRTVHRSPVPVAIIPIRPT